jgi:hydroxyacylglutathione hydrolase
MLHPDRTQEIAMTAITAQAIPILSDNYAWLLHDPATGFTAIVDPAEEAPIMAAIKAIGGRLDLILLTHHHQDHIAAVEPIRAATAARVIGALADAHRLPRLDLAVEEGDVVALGSVDARVIETPGHTTGHISYFIPEDGVNGGLLLCADTLFSLGCGRLTEGGTGEDLFNSLQKLAALPPDTLVCCGHEYTQSNARFALTEEPANARLRERADEVDRLRAAGQPTVPSTMAAELAANPFLHATTAEEFSAMRRRKDVFR